MLNHVETLNPEFLGSNLAPSPISSVTLDTLSNLLVPWLPRPQNEIKVRNNPGGFWEPNNARAVRRPWKCLAWSACWSAPIALPSWMAQPRAAAKPCKVESHQILALGPALFFCRDKGSGSHMLSFALQLSQSLLTVTSFLWMSFGAHILSMVPPLPPDMTPVAFGQLVF